jgi:tRNA-2-methylthio-N6-dimethylallyladenosine synthase
VINDNVKRISESRVGTVQRILVEGASRKSTGAVPELMGRTECNRVVNFEGGPVADRLIGQMVDVRITKALAYTLRGEVVVS